ncbi:MAG: 2-oxoglutarate dehydrogenase E1 component [Pseudomonadota bacterium]|nr:2-oxoglutarate dehydrogenase E1 component [Pseudomonadota bacterium]
MKGKQQSYEHFKLSELYSHESMSYVEEVFEALVDGQTDSPLSSLLTPFLDVPTQHRRLCDRLAIQDDHPQVLKMVQSALPLIQYYKQYAHLGVDLGLFDDFRVKVPVPSMPGILVGVLDQEYTQPESWWHETLKAMYQSTIGFEFSYTQPNEQAWFDTVLASMGKPTQEERLKAYADLYRAEQLEKHLGIQFVGQKRFSLEGAESFIPLVDAVISQHVKDGYDDVVIGMAHRGRLNTLVNILGVSVETLMAEFEGKNKMEGTSGDVKYHLGHSVDRVADGKEYHIALAYNPSHLEAINSVVMGNVRARIDRGATKPVGILVHGDASIAGQGVVMENLSMSQVPAYHIGGIVHIVINNQIGFTTNPIDARSTPYCTDIAKMISAPVMHVNCQHVDSVITVAKIAAQYRDQFKKDVFIDLIGHRKYGHNEADEPRATQPLMYEMLKHSQLVSSQYKKQLLQDGISEETLNEIEQNIINAIKQKSSLIQCSHEPRSTRHKDWVSISQGAWDSQYDVPYHHDDLVVLANKLLNIPEGAILQKQVENMHKQRHQMIDGTLDLNWGMAELLAYQVLLDQGHSVRLAGQDAIRGTFSHRHASLFDQRTGERLELPKSTDHAKFMNYNSILSEYGCLGFEYGYSETSPNALVVFEAQFGDFINGAQIMIDQFISSGYQKWQRYCGLVMLLPHGYEGQGPEHSSARLERFLQLCAQENMQVCMPTTPKQIFHVLIRQIFRSYRTPLVIFSPKSLLRHPKAVTPIKDLLKGQFESLILDGYTDAKTLVICSGRIYYDLLLEQEKLGSPEQFSLLRIEQLHPFPQKMMQSALKKYKRLSRVVWCQDEPKNQGAWEYIAKHMIGQIDDTLFECVARDEAASPAVGYMSKHKNQQSKLMKEVFRGE